MQQQRLLSPLVKLGVGCERCKVGWNFSPSGADWVWGLSWQ